MLLTRIDHVGIAVPNLDDAVALYETTFGLKVVPDDSNPADRSYVIFEDNELRRCARTGPWTRECTRVEQ